VAHHIDLGQLRQCGQIVAQEARLEDRLGLRHRHVGFGNRVADASRAAALEEQRFFHERP